MNPSEAISSIWKHDPELWGEEDWEENIRRELGDYVDIFSIQSIQSSLLLYDPSSISKIYTAIRDIVEDQTATWVENKGLDDFYIKKFKNLKDKTAKNKYFSSILEEHQDRIFRNLGLGTLNLVEVGEDRVVLEVKESVEGYKAPKIGYPICFNVAGILAGEMLGRFGDWTCYEESCISTGGKSCKFVIAPQEVIIEEVRKFLDLPSTTSFSFKGRLISLVTESTSLVDYTPVKENIINKLLKVLRDMKSQPRPELGYEIKIRALQQYYLSFFVDDFDKGTKLLYNSGYKWGINFFRVVSSIGREDEKSIKNILTRTFSRLGIGILSFSKEVNSYRICVEECAYSSGLDLDSVICCFNSGFFSGVLTALNEKEYSGKEIRCSAASGDKCIHEISVGESK